MCGTPNTMLAASPNPCQISVAELAIQARLQDALTYQPLTCSEIKAIRYALHHLRLLKKEMDRLDPMQDGKPVMKAITSGCSKQHAA